MKAMVTGIAGFLGSHLARALVKRGWEVVGIDNLLGGYEDNVPAGANLVRGDCNNLSLVREFTRGTDVVYHCAATAYEGLSVFSPKLVTENVVGATASVLSAACSVGVKRFVHCSSMARYGSNRVPFDETMPPRPIDPYAIGKVASEELVRTLCAVHGLEWSIAVPHNIYGPGQKYDDPFRNVAAIFVNRMLRGEQPIVYGDGGQRRSFSYIDDVVDPLLRMGTEASVVGRVVNLGPDDEFVTVLELARLVADVVGDSFKGPGLAPIFVPDRPLEVRHATCSADLARELLGYEPKVPLRQGIESLVAWVRARGPRPFRYHLPVEIVTDKTPETWRKRMM
jgi:UDP-glucose 4-epimerase